MAWQKSSRSGSQGNCVEIMPLHSVPEGWAIGFEVQHEKATFSCYKIDSGESAVKFNIEIDHKARSLKSSLVVNNDIPIGPELEMIFELDHDFTPVEIVAMVVYKYLLIFEEKKDEEMGSLVKGVLLELSSRQAALQLVSGNNLSAVEIVINPEERANFER